ncbi:MAG: T9SS type A sorting domain-containing protein [Chitinophagales bacterium]|nr:T9SS type A sorting domain-containing protein [Chitinophagales bacterium]
MKQNYFLVALLFAFFFSANDAFSVPSLQWLGCKKVKVKTNPSSSICGNCYAWPSAPYKMYARFDVHKINANGTTGQMVTSKITPYADFYIFNSDAASYLEENTPYRIKVYFAVKLDGICYDHPQVSGGCLGAWMLDGETDIIEFGEIVHTYSLLDYSGIINNDVFCKDHLDAIGTVPLLGGAQNETGWSIDICQRNPGQTSGCINWTGTGWQSGPMPETVDLLNDVWRFHHSNWDFWPGYEYKVQVAFSKTGCDSWNAEDFTFSVVPGSSGCRILDGFESQDVEVHLFPNPTSDFIQLSGWEIPEDGTPYQIIDITGKKVKQDHLSDYRSSVAIDDLSKGIYIIQLEINDSIISKRFTVM